MSLKVFTADDVTGRYGSFTVGGGSGIKYSMWGSPDERTVVRTYITTVAGDFLSARTDITKDIKKIGESQAVANVLNAQVGGFKEKLAGLDNGLNPVLADVITSLFEKIGDLESRISSLES